MINEVCCFNYILPTIYSVGDECVNHSNDHIGYYF